MGLRQRKRIFRFGMPEGLAMLLILAATWSGASWWMKGRVAYWRETTATVLRAERLSERPLFGLLPSMIALDFAYTVDGRAYNDRAVLGVPAQISLRLFRHDAPAPPPPANGFIGMNDLPREIRELLESRGVVGLERIPDKFVNSLYAKGYTTVKDFPEDVRAALRDGDYRAVAAFLDAHLPHASAPPPPAPAETDSLPQDLFLGPGDTFHILYNPRHPSQTRVMLVPGASAIPSITPFVMFALLALAYSAWGYPFFRRWWRRD